MLQKIGNKTIYNGIDTKLAQLKEEGFDDVSVEVFSAFWSILSTKTETQTNLRISFAKTGCGFYNDAFGGRGKSQLFYSRNPSRASKGFKLWVKKNSGQVSGLYNQLKEQYSLMNETSFYISSEGDLILEAGLLPEIGKDRYKALLQDVASIIK